MELAQLRTQLLQVKMEHLGAQVPEPRKRLEKITCDERLELEGKFSISEEEKTGEHSIKPQVDKKNGISTACRSYSLVDDSGSVTEFSCDLSS